MGRIVLGWMVGWAAKRKGMGTDFFETCQPAGAEHGGVGRCGIL